MRYAVLLAELKRRKVLRVAAAYGASAFAVLQAAEIIFPRLSLPDWTVTLVVALALVGLPMALALAWAFEAGPEGVRRTAPAAPQEIDAILAQPRRRRWPIVIAAGGGVLLLAVGAAWTLTSHGRSAAGRYDSIAVLPFANLSGDPQNEYFGDGLAEELLNALSGIEGLKVAARTSAFAFRGTNVDVRAIGDTLHVATVLEGSVRRSADRIRIGVQLTDARSGYNLWSETYDRPLSDLFAVQETIAGEIVRALAGRLAPTQQRELYLGGTKDLEAYDLYLQGRQRWATRQIPQLREAVEDFEMAIQRDSAFALAWSGLADAIEALAWRVPAERPRIAEGKYAAQRALALEPALAEAWTSVGGIAMDFDRDFTMAELTLRRAIALKPSYAVPYNWLGDALRYSGRIDAALEVSTQGIRLDPLNGGALNTHVSLLVRKGRVTEARRFADQSLAIGFQDSGMFLNLLSAVRVLGYTAEDAEAFATGWAAAVGHPHPEAVALVGRAVMDPELRPSARSLIHELSTMQVRSRDLATLSLCIEDMDGAIGYLQRGLEEGDPNLIMIGTSRAFDPLRSDPRFIRIVEALGLPNGA